MQLKLIKELFHQELDALYTSEEVNHFFYRMVEHYLGLERFVLVLDPAITITKSEEQPFFEGLAGLKQQRPIQYILGLEYFMDLPISVNEHVLIPRPETEELVRWILADWKDHHKTPTVLDIGTGSGCIAIALKKFLPEASIYGLDISTEALNLAQQNARTNEVAIEFIEGNILQALELKRKFDVIVSNPPYVRDSERESMEKNVKEHEPGLALFVEDKDPLKFYESIAEFSKSHLVKDGPLYLEINQYLAQRTKSLLETHNFSEIEVRKDIYGKYRMIKAIWKNTI